MGKKNHLIVNAWDGGAQSSISLDGRTLRGIVALTISIRSSERTRLEVEVSRDADGNPLPQHEVVTAYLSANGPAIISGWLEDTEENRAAVERLTQLPAWSDASVLP